MSDSERLAPEEPQTAEGIPHRDIERALGKILASTVFADAPRMRRLLSYLVKETLAGHAKRLKQYTLAIDVFDQAADFDPRFNSTVRVQISKLRHELERYYCTNRGDPVRLEIPSGQYHPVFTKTAPPGGRRTTVERNSPTPHRPNGPAMAGIPLGKGRLPPPAPYPTIAVTPLRCLGAAAELEYLSRGLTEDLINGLTHFSYLRIIPLGAELQRGGKARDRWMFNRASGARYLFEGSVQQVLDTVRVAARLVDATGGVIVWSQVYDCTPATADGFAAQDEITAAIIGSIAQPYGVILSIDRQQARWRKEFNQLDSYDVLLEIYAYWQALSPDHHRRLRDRLERMIGKYPYCGDLWTLLSHVYLDEARFEHNPRSSDPLERSAEAARHAIELDPHGSAYAHQALFWAYASKGDITALEATGEHALALNPYHMEIMADFGSYLSLAGEWSEGIPLVRRATAFDSNAHGAYYLALFSDALRRQDYPAALAAANTMAMKMPY